MNSTLLDSLIDIDTNPTPSSGKVIKVVNENINVLNFNPNKDKLDLGDFSVHDMVTIETSRGVGFRDPSTNKTYTLVGIFLKDLTVDNFLPVASDHLREDIGAILAQSRGEVNTKLPDYQSRNPIFHT